MHLQREGIDRRSTRAKAIRRKYYEKEYTPETIRQSDAPSQKTLRPHTNGTHQPIHKRAMKPSATAANRLPIAPNSPPLVFIAPLPSRPLEIPPAACTDEDKKLAPHSLSIAEYNADCPPRRILCPRPGP